MPQMRRDLEVWFWLVLSSMRVYNTPPWLAQAEGKQKLGFAKLSPKYLIRDSPDAVLASAALPSSQKILAADAVLNPPRARCRRQDAAYGVIMCGYACVGCGRCGKPQTGLKQPFKCLACGYLGPDDEGVCPTCGCSPIPPGSPANSSMLRAVRRTAGKTREGR